VVRVTHPHHKPFGRARRDMPPLMHFAGKQCVSAQLGHARLVSPCIWGEVRRL
jgi:hypothetical protein